jgi:hypothetical protein
LKLRSTKAYEAFSSVVSIVTAVTFRFGRRPGSSAEPGWRQGWLRREPLAELDEPASRALAERKTVSASRLVGETHLRREAAIASDLLVREPQAKLRMSVHLMVPFMRPCSR